MGILGDFASDGEAMASRDLFGGKKFFPCIMGNSKFIYKFKVWVSNYYRTCFVYKCYAVPKIV